MKPPFQKNCQTYHHATERCPKGICPLPRGYRSEGPTDKAKAREQVDDTVGGEADLPQPPKASRGGKRVVEPLNEEVREKVKRGEISDTAAGVALTAAQKQKDYRERHAERVREANRLRMREKRKRDG